MLKPKESLPACFRPPEGFPPFVPPHKSKHFRPHRDGDGLVRVGRPQRYLSGLPHWVEWEHLTSQFWDDHNYLCIRGAAPPIRLRRTHASAPTPIGHVEYPAVWVDGPSCDELLRPARVGAFSTPTPRDLSVLDRLITPGAYRHGRVSYA